MGITVFEIELLNKCINIYKPESVIEAGAQNVYLNGEEKPPFATEFYNEHGILYRSIDLTGDNKSYKYDLAYPINHARTYSLVTNFGTAEHIVQSKEYDTVEYHDGYIKSVYPKGDILIEEGFYNCWLNLHNLCKKGGLIISVNPMTTMWEGHGYSYLGEDFYKELVKISGYELLETGLNGATGNWETGVNVYGVIKKISDDFPDFETFQTLPIFKK